MNRQAFEHGLRLELEKLSYERAAPQAAAAFGSPAPASTAGNKTITGDMSGTPRPPQVDRGARTSALRNEQSIAQTESQNVPGVLRSGLHELGMAFTPRPLVKQQITSQVNATKPGEVVKPLSGSEMLMQDSILNDEESLNHAKQEGARFANEKVWQTNVADLSGLKDQYRGANTPLNNAVRQHIAYDPASVAGINDAVSHKTYGSMGVKPGLESKFTPTNMLEGDNMMRLLKDHWPKLLAGGGLVAALMYALKGNDDERQQQGPVINNYMGGGMPAGQPQFGRMPGYNQ